MFRSTPKDKEMTEEKNTLQYDKNTTMRGRTMVFVGVIAAAVAALMFVFLDQATVSRIVVAGGVLLVGAGVFNLLFFNNGSGLNRLLTSLTNSAAVVLGVCMLVFRGTFEPMVPFIFGLIVALCSLWQFYALAVGIRPFTLPSWYYVFPLALAAFAIYIFVRRESIDSATIVGVTAAALAVFAAGAIVEGLHAGVLHRKASPDTEDNSADLDEPIGVGARTSAAQQAANSVQTAATKNEPDTAPED